jgi:hypothetical protein
MKYRGYRLALMLLVVLAVVVPVRPAQAQTSTLTEDQVIDQVMQINAVTGADDLTAELTQLSQSLVNDPVDYGSMGYDFTRSAPLILYSLGSTVGTLSMILPLLPGPMTDPTSLQAQLAARLKTEVTTRLLNQTYWQWEYQTSTASPYLQAFNPRISLSWVTRWQGGSHWDKMYALWAYAYYTGDWATIQNNWSFIKARYQEGDRTPGAEQRTILSVSGVGFYRNASNDLANGLIGYVRMADHFKDATAAQARTEAKAALAEVLQRVNTSWASCPITEGWDNTALTMKGEWTPGQDLTPELGRWINAQSRSVAQTRLDEAANAGELRGHWWAGYLNNVSKGSAFHEDLWAPPNLSHELFLGRAWMLQESGASLRPVLPWHVVMGSTPEYRDMLYFRSLYALITRYASTAYVAANS